MKTTILILTYLSMTFSLFSQTPFTTLFREPRLLEKITLPDQSFWYKRVDSTNTIMKYLNDSVGFDKSNFVTVKPEDLSFFKNNNLSLNLANKGENRLSLNSDIIHYKLYLGNPNNLNDYRLSKFNIPLLLISKISTLSDSLTKSSAYDVLDYSGSPLTLRLMPSWMWEYLSYNDVLYFGLYSDLRGIQTSNTQLNLEYIWSNGVGLTYQGDSEGAKFSENGSYSQGRYSLSIMYQFATANKNLINKLFDTKNNFAHSFQGIFIIKLGNESPINLRIGYQYYVTKILNGSKSNITIAVGI